VKRATIKDVARRAGVSTATVSFVLNANPKEAISEGVRRRVLDAARALTYHPSAAAAALARRRVRNVALVFYKDVDTITNQFYSFVVQGAVKEALERDYDLLFSYVDGTYAGYQSLPKIVREKNAGGVLFMRRIEPRMVKDIRALGIPMVAVDQAPRLDGVDSIQIDNRRGGMLAAEHLAQLGHERMAMLVPRHPPPSIEERLEGFCHGLDKCDLRFSKAANVVVAEALSYEAGYQAARSTLGKSSLTALFCSNDEMAAGVLRAAHELGRRVPRDLSVIGFDDITMANYTDPPLTTVGVVKEHMGRRAMARLIELVEQTDVRVKTEIAPVELVTRASTSVARERASRRS
jgi:DNA-binding LacI/PurR family transcriptional regulator